MRTTIELPDLIYRKGQEAARAQGVTLENFILRVFERKLKVESLSPVPHRRVTLPLLPSKEPGTMDLEGLNFDDFLT